MNVKHKSITKFNPFRKEQEIPHESKLLKECAMLKFELNKRNKIIKEQELKNKHLSYSVADLVD